MPHHVQTFRNTGLSINHDKCVVTIRLKPFIRRMFDGMRYSHLSRDCMFRFLTAINVAERVGDISCWNVTILRRIGSDHCLLFKLYDSRELIANLWVTDTADYGNTKRTICGVEILRRDPSSSDSLRFSLFHGYGTLIRRNYVAKLGRSEDLTYNRYESHGMKCHTFIGPHTCKLYDDRASVVYSRNYEIKIDRRTYV